MTLIIKNRSLVRCLAEGCISLDEHFILLAVESILSTESKAWEVHELIVMLIKLG